MYANTLNSLSEMSEVYEMNIAQQPANMLTLTTAELDALEGQWREALRWHQDLEAPTPYLQPIPAKSTCQLVLGEIELTRRKMAKENAR